MVDMGYSQNIVLDTKISPSLPSPIFLKKPTSGRDNICQKSKLVLHKFQSIYLILGTRFRLGVEHIFLIPYNMYYNLGTYYLNYKMHKNCTTSGSNWTSNWTNAFYCFSQWGQEQIICNKPWLLSCHLLGSVYTLHFKPLCNSNIVLYTYVHIYLFMIL